ncbi:MAG: amidohydrolase family protein [Breznakibacter sp.]
MIRTLFYIPIVLLLLEIGSGCRAPRCYDMERIDKLAFINARVIPMTHDTLLEGHTVLIDNGLIEQMGPGAEVEIPRGYRVIDINGRYMMPGLTDMHVHLSDKRDMLRFLSHGITTVRHMSDLPWWANAMGFPSILELRQQQREGRIAGPRIFTCGMTLDGQPPVSPMNQRITSVKEARETVVGEKARGYDAIKLYDNLTFDVYKAIVCEARRVGIPVAGHVPHAVPLDTILKDKILSIEHLTGYIDNKTAGYTIDTARLENYLALTRGSGVYNVPTLAVWACMPPEDGLEKLKNDPRYKELAWQVKWMWKTALPYYYQIDYPDKANYTRQMAQLTGRLAKRLSDAGCPLLIGTDTNIAGTYVGDATLLEMELFVEYGIPVYETLRSATILPAQALGVADETGTVEPGKWADLLILDQNPLTGIGYIRSTYGVYCNGVYWIAGR